MKRLSWSCVLAVAMATTAAAPAAMHNEIPPTPLVIIALDGWDVICWFAPWAPMCPRKIKDPVLPGDCDFIGPCQS